MYIVAPIWADDKRYISTLCLTMHYPYFVSCKLSEKRNTTKRPKYIKKRVNDKLAYESLSDIVNDMITELIHIMLQI